MTSLPNNIINFKHSASLEDEIKTVILKWTINDFRQTLQSRKNISFEITKESYLPNTDEAVMFKLYLETFGAENDLIEIHYLPGTAPLCVKYFLYSVGNGRHKSILAAKNYQWVYSNRENLNMLASLYKRDVLELLSQDSLALEFQFFFNYTGPVDDEDSLYVNLQDVNSHTLNKDLGDLFISSDLADMTIKSAEGVGLPVHRTILSARSAVLKAHFDHGTKETITNIVESSFETEVLKVVLQYIYTDEIQKIENDIPAEKILAAADFYQLERLKLNCEIQLTKKLSVENAIEILQLSNLYSAKHLKKSTLKFIKAGRIGEIIATNGYKSLKSMELLKSILDNDS